MNSRGAMGSGVPAGGMRLLLGVVVLLLPWFGAPAHGQGPELVVYRQLDRPVLTIRSSGAASGARSQRHPASPASMAPTRTRASFCSAEQTPMLGRACKARTRSFLIRLATSGTPSTEAPIPRLCLPIPLWQVGLAALDGKPEPLGERDPRRMEPGWDAPVQLRPAVRGVCAKSFLADVGQPLSQFQFGRIQGSQRPHQVSHGTYLYARERGQSAGRGTARSGSAGHWILTVSKRSFRRRGLAEIFPHGFRGTVPTVVSCRILQCLQSHHYDITGCGGSRATIGSGNFGLINGVNSNPRQGQFGFRFEF